MPKKMRLGTRSCTECRRRKVRCVFDNHSNVCQACKVHETPCKKQGLQSSSNSNDGSTLNGQQKLESLERVVRRICEAVNLDAESSSLLDFEITTTDALRHLGALNASDDRDHDMSESQWENNESDTRVDLGPSDEIGGCEQIVAEDAPLLSLFKDATIVERIDSQAYDDWSSVLTKKQIQSKVEALKALIPTLDSLSLILEQTNKYWTIWPVWPLASENLSSETGSSFSSQVTLGKTFILHSLQSQKPLAVAKAVIWLALCIQQLPANFGSQHPSLPAPPSTLLKAYLNGADTLLAAMDAEAGRDVDSIECLVLKAKAFIDMGKPRKAWLDNRRAINAALLLGLNQPSRGSQDGHSGLWGHVWQLDRQLSMILGLPYAIIDSDPSIAQGNLGLPISLKLLRELSIICGHIVDRNRTHQHIDYSITTQIERELDKCRSAIPDEWWNDQGSETYIQESYFRYMVKFYTDFLYKMLHLPYMLKNFTSTTFEHSRLRALTASKSLIDTYQVLQHDGLPAGVHVICDLMDFQVFSAAIVLVINLLSPQPYLWRPQQISEDWALIADLIQTYRRLASEVQCSVAAQAAQVLEYLVMAHNGTYSSTEPYEVTIPYFGKVKIRQINQAELQTEHALPFIGPRDPPLEAPATDFSNSIEFSTNLFEPFDANPVEGNSIGDELGVSWTTFPDSLPSYDWSHLFYDVASAGQSDEYVGYKGHSLF